MVGKFLNDRYELIEKIGEGGMAEVYKAKCHVLQRFVAVKILKSQFHEDYEFIKKFDVESKSAAKLNHPNVVNIFDVGIEGEIRFIVMEYIDGITLKKYIKEQEGFLSDNKIIDFSLQIAMALEHAHKNNIIHRDIKPQNIMISKDGIIKVADFGIAQAVSSSTVINTREMVGSVHYSSPEQTRGKIVDNRTDIYSLGIVMYEMATGHLPFSGETAIAVALKHMKEQVLEPSKINKGLSQGLENIILKALKKNPEHRYQKINELISDLYKIRANPDEKIFIYDEDENPTIYLPELEENDDMPKKKKSRKKYKKKDTFSNTSVILLALIASLIIFGMIGVSIFSDKFAIKDASVPNVINMSLEDAKNKLNDAGFYIEQDGSRYSNVIENGYVIEQSEQPGEILKEGFTVKVIISKGEKLITVPKLIQKELNEVKVILENSELVIGELEYVKNDLPQDYIISQSPQYGDKIEVGGVINLVISLGSSQNEYIMPKIIGLTKLEALNLIDELSLYFGGTSYEYSDEYAQDVIISQSITQGTMVVPGTKIDVVVSNGKEPEKLTTKDFKISTNDFINDKAVITVEVFKDENSIIVYQKEHLKSEEIIIISVEASGEVILNFYFDDELYKRMTVNF